MPTTSKSRSFPVKGPDSSYVKTDFVYATGQTRVTTGSGSWKTQFGKKWDGRQITVSENHPSWKARRGPLLQDIGGNFSMERRVLESKLVRKGLKGKLDIPGHEFQNVSYTGWILPHVLNDVLDVFPPFRSSADWQLDAFGTEAIARCKPTNSVADVSVFLGELLREGLPNLVGASVKDRTLKARQKAGSEYLNVEFGWKPVARDVRKFISAVNEADRVLAQYERDSGRVVRRRYEFPPIRETSTVTWATDVRPAIGFVLNALYVPGEVPKGRVIRTRETTIRRWFSGAFTYYLDAGGDARGEMARRAQMSKKLLGISLTPDTVWNLAPWTWAVDWFSNAGDVVSNITDWAVDGLVLRYGYIMEHSIVRDTYTFVGPTSFQSKEQRPQELVFVSERKLRRKATPFGFGLSWSGLSPRQLAIAAALGLTRS